MVHGRFGSCFHGQPYHEVVHFKNRYNAPFLGLDFSRVQLLSGNFYARFFLCENLVLTGNSTKILLPARHLTGIQEETFFPGGNPARTDFLVKFLLVYIFPGRIQLGKLATSVPIYKGKT